MNEKMTLEEFVRKASPIPDDNIEQEAQPEKWEKYMQEANEAHDNALIMLGRQLYHAAYWNALDAIGCYAAAHAAYQDDSQMLANSKETRAYLAAIAGAKSEQPHLYRQYACSKPNIPSPIDAAKYKIKPKLHWKGRNLYCGEILLAEAWDHHLDTCNRTFEFDDLVCDYYRRDFKQHWAGESQQGRTIDAVLEEIYIKGFEDIEIKPDGDSWKYDLHWCDDVFIDMDDDRPFLFGNAGNLFLGGRYIGILYANVHDEYCFDPYYFRKYFFRKADGRLLQDERLIVPAQVNPRDVVEAIMQDVLSLLDVELVLR